MGVYEAVKHFGLDVWKLYHKDECECSVSMVEYKRISQTQCIPTGRCGGCGLLIVPRMRGLVA